MVENYLEDTIYVRNRNHLLAYWQQFYSPIIQRIPVGSKTIVYRDCDVSYNCNDTVSQLECSVLTFMEKKIKVKIKAFDVKIKALLLFGKNLRFCAATN